MEQAGEHLEGGGLARAVGAEEADQFAFLNGEADLIDGEGLFVAAMEEAAHSAAKARLLFVRAKSLGQTVDFDQGHFDAGPARRDSGPAGGCAPRAIAAIVSPDNGRPGGRWHRLPCGL